MSAWYWSFAFLWALWRTQQSTDIAQLCRIRVLKSFKFDVILSPFSKSHRFRECEVCPKNLTWKNSEKKSEKPLTSVKRVETRTLGRLRSGIAPDRKKSSRKIALEGRLTTQFYTKKTKLNGCGMYKNAGNECLPRVIRLAVSWEYSWEVCTGMRTTPTQIMARTTVFPHEEAMTTSP